MSTEYNGLFSFKSTIKEKNKKKQKKIELRERLFHIDKYK